MSDHIFSVAGGTEWIVRVFSFPTRDAARLEWERIEEMTQGKEYNFSIWRTTVPDETKDFIILCGKIENLPEVIGGTPFAIPREFATKIVLRRAKTGADAFEEHPEKEHYEQRMRYGETAPVVIDKKGGVKPYRRRD